MPESPAEPKPAPPTPTEGGEPAPTEKRIDEGLDETFPASDPPAVRPGEDPKPE